jgi:hypothetical protein
MPCLLMIIEATYWNVCPVVEAVVVSGSTFPFSPWEKKKDHASIVFWSQKMGCGVGDGNRVGRSSMCSIRFLAVSSATISSFGKFQTTLSITPFFVVHIEYRLKD